MVAAIRNALEVIQKRAVFPYQEAKAHFEVSQRLWKGSPGEPSTLKNRAASVMHLATSALLIIPIVNYVFALILYLCKGPSSPGSGSTPSASTGSFSLPTMSFLHPTGAESMSSRSAATRQNSSRGSSTQDAPLDAPAFVAIDSAGELSKLTISVEPTNGALYELKPMKNITGVSAQIGMYASCLLPWGNARYHALEDKLPGCANLRVCPPKAKESGRIHLNFTDANYAKRLSASLQAIGIVVEYQDVDIPPDESGYDYYHGAVVFTDARAFLLFAREFCLQSSSTIQEYVNVRKTEFLEKNEPLPLIISYIEQHNSKYNPTTIKKVGSIESDEIFLPPRIAVWGVSTSVGAMTSLLVSGYNSLANARQCKNIVHVTFSEDQGLSLYFPDPMNPRGGFHSIGHSQAAKTQSGLQKHGLQFSFDQGVSKDRPYKDKDRDTQADRQFSGCIYSKDPETIARYLLQVCQQSRRAIKDMIENSSIKASLGQRILEHANRQIEGEEKLDVRVILQEELTSITSAHVKVSNHRLRLSTLPDLPDEAKKIDLAATLKEEFDKLKSKIISEGLNDNHTLDQLTTGINNTILMMGGTTPYSGVPKDSIEKKIFLNSYRFHLRHVLYLLPHVPNHIKLIQMSQLAIGGFACVARMVSAVRDAYTTFICEVTSPKIKAFYTQDAYTDEKLSPFDRELILIIDPILAGLRSSIFELLVAKYQAKMGGDPSHTKNKFLKILKAQAIPGAELADYSDPYAAHGLDVNPEELNAEFDSENTPEAMINILDERLRYGKIEMTPVIEFLQYHAPLKYHQSPHTVEEFSGEAFVEHDDYIPLNIKKEYLLQMLLITGHLEKKKNI
ncbi:MAG: hypothetical protein HKM07_08135 [Chlamydiae bacterium]|nr:hypothetical protein [Chlamydiota bacterium]